jgi:N6-L-threonylcarbamoyladenine synthase
MKILAIETSCDETGIAVVEAATTGDTVTFTVLGNALLSQAKLHAEYGGVFPNLAKREHEKNLPIMLAEAIQKSGLKNVAEVDAIAVTNGPGLEPALWTGVEFAKQLAKDCSRPLFPTNHMEGHLISSLVTNGVLENVQFPVLGLLVSGGHTEFVLMKDWFKYEIIGETLDDAVGEAFDKVARMLNLPYPGGPEISKIAMISRTNNTESKAKLPRPMIAADTCDVSFSGLKTAALYALRDMGGIQTLSADEIAAFAREFEDSVTEVLVAKTKRALEQTGATTFVLGGGVAANKNIREVLEKEIKADASVGSPTLRRGKDTKFDVDFRLPELAITGDNAIMIAEAALVHLVKGDWQLSSPPSPDFRAVGNLSIAS